MFVILKHGSWAFHPLCLLQKNLNMCTFHISAMFYFVINISVVCSLVLFSFLSSSSGRWKVFYFPNFSSLIFYVENSPINKILMFQFNVLVNLNGSSNFLQNTFGKCLLTSQNILFQSNPKQFSKYIAIKQIKQILENVLSLSETQ